MKKTWVIIGGVVLVIVAAFAYLLLSGNKASSPSANQASDLPARAEDQPANQQAEAPQPGTYKAFEGGDFEQASGKTRRVIFFHAPWCPQCRELDQSITAGKIPSGVTIYKLDYDTSHYYRNLYGVTQQTTFVEVDANGKLVNKYNAYYTTTLEAVVKGLKL